MHYISCMLCSEHSKTDLQQQGMTVVHAACHQADSRSLGVDQNTRPTLVAYGGMWRTHMADFLRHEQSDLTLLALVCVLDVEGKSRLEGLKYDMRALELDIKMHLIQSRSTGDPCKCRCA